MTQRVRVRSNVTLTIELTLSGPRFRGSHPRAKDPAEDHPPGQRPRRICELFVTTPSMEAFFSSNEAFFSKQRGFFFKRVIDHLSSLGSLLARPHILPVTRTLISHRDFTQ